MLLEPFWLAVRPATTGLGEEAGQKNRPTVCLTPLRWPLATRTENWADFNEFANAVAQLGLNWAVLDESRNRAAYRPMPARHCG